MSCDKTTYLALLLTNGRVLSTRCGWLEVCQTWSAGYKAAIQHLLMALSPSCRSCKSMPSSMGSYVRRSLALHSCQKSCSCRHLARLSCSQAVSLHQQSVKNCAEFHLWFLFPDAQASYRQQIRFLDEQSAKRNASTYPSTPFELQKTMEHSARLITMNPRLRSTIPAACQMIDKWLKAGP